MYNFKSIKMNTNLKMLAALAAITLTSPVATLYATVGGQEVSQAVMTIRGNVKDVNGEPLIGVSISVKGRSGQGTVTDIDGNFTLQCEKGNVLSFSYIGYKTTEVKVGNKSDLMITLQEDTEQLEEVIVVGYGTTTRKSAVGSVSQVKSEAITKRPVANVTQALQGAAPGVIVQQTSYNPNDNKTNFNIRGISTLNDNSPLIVIDGIVSDGGSFNKLNPNDIENISVLKDAGTAAIYGSRSANGVIVVTTKSGKKNEKPTVRLNGSVGWQNPDILFSPVAGYQNATLTNLANTNVGNDPKFTPEQIRDLAAHQSEESWFYDQIMRTALQQNYNLSVSGGSANTTYMVSMGYFDQESNYVGNKNFGVERYNFRTNINTEVGRFKLNAILAYTRNNSISTTGSSLEIDAERVPTYYYYKMKSADGRYLLNDILSEFNPLGALEAGGFNKYRNNYLNANVSAEMKIIDGLSLKGVLGADVINDTRFTRNNAVEYYASEDATTPRPVNLANNKTSNWNSDAYLINTQLLLNYNKTFGKHTVNGLFGVTNESYTYTANEIEKKYVDPS
jgi:TonB-linked SusC/RagA family outer membrane protein